MVTINELAEIDYQFFWNKELSIKTSTEKNLKQSTVLSAQ
jgi:hypothetical protein